jgi:hypothetical protein
MKCIALTTILTIIFSGTLVSQTLPAKVTSFLNHFYAGWSPASGTCENRKWFLTGDFDGNGMKDYLVRVKTGKTARSKRLNLIAFFGFEDRMYPAKQILDDPHKGDFLRSSFSVVKKGTKIQLGEGEGPTITLENDAASQYICQTDAIKTLVYKGGKWKNIYEE